jgi:hypothetical protein
MRDVNQFFIFSTEFYKNTSKENEQSTSHTKKILEKSGIPYKILDGVYKGVSETSFLVNAKYENQVMELAKAAKQESVLFVDINRNAYLIYLDNNKTEKLGILTRVSEDKALTLDAYSKDGDIYYSVI